MKHAFIRFGALLVIVMSVACAEPPPAAPVTPPDTRAQDEAAIRAASKAWASAAQTKNAAQFTSFYTSDAVLMIAGMPAVRSRAELEKMGTEMMQDPNFALTFSTGRVEVARSGDLAYETGTWQMTNTDPKTKKPVTEKGEFVTVWKKQADGSWKVAIDVPVAIPDPPAAPRS